MQLFPGGTAVLILHNSQSFFFVVVVVLFSLSYFLWEKFQLSGRKRKYSFSPSHETCFRNTGLSYSSELFSIAMASIPWGLQRLSGADSWA